MSSRSRIADLPEPFREQVRQRFRARRLVAASAALGFTIAGPPGVVAVLSLAALSSGPSTGMQGW